MPILFSLTLFVSALLLFMVQPMIGRMILPTLGGSPAAWNTCMVFFQMMLLLGYLYAHKLSARLTVRKQVLVHVGVLAAAVAAFALAVLLGDRNSPIHIQKSLVPQDSSYPMFGVMAMLVVAIGVPFFAVSASAPLLTRWFSKTTHPAARDPYFLYATSNAGSLLSLLTYPILTEPSLSLVEQAWLFAGGFAVLALLAFICGRTAVAHLRPDATDNQTLAPAAPPTKLRIAKWIALAFVPSSLMLGVTFYMTTDIASIPLLWVIPLALYLLTFIIAFLRLPSWFRVVLGNIAPVVTLLLLYIIITQETLENPFLLIGLHLLAFFLLALMCHSELAYDRPPPQYLTNFFLWISVGGVLGGIFNALLAPLLFPLAYEYTIALTLGCMLVPKLNVEPLSPKKAKQAWMLDYAIPAAMLVIVTWLAAVAGTDTMWEIANWILNKFNWLLRNCGVNRIVLNQWKIIYGINWAVPLICCFFFIDRPLRFGLCVAAIVLVGEFKRSNQEFHTERSFFGILKIRNESDEDHDLRSRSLVHGTTLHGRQGMRAWPELQRIREPLSALIGPALVYSYDWPSEPLTYYHQTGAVGQLFQVTRERHPKANVAMVGLGTGSAACYADKDCALTFFEIDPTVKGLVADRKRDAAWQARRQRNTTFDTLRDPFFSYVIDAEERGADVKFVMGDARIKLESMPDARYDLLLVDAFSSDSIPVHLLTKEALELYFNRLTPDGLLALHISNKFVRLDLVVAKLAEALGATAYVYNDSFVDDDKRADHQFAPPGKTPSHWVVLAKDPKLLEVFNEPRFTLQYRYVEPLVLNGEGKLVPRADSDPVVWEKMKAHPKMKVWTDDFADVMQVMMLPEVQKARGWFGLTTLDDLEKTKSDP